MKDDEDSKEADDRQFPTERHAIGNRIEEEILRNVRQKFYHRPFNGRK